MSASSLKPQLNSLTKHGNRIRVRLVPETKIVENLKTWKLVETGSETEWDLFRRRRSRSATLVRRTGFNSELSSHQSHLHHQKPHHHRRHHHWRKKASSKCLEAKILSAFMKNICHTELGLLHQLLLKCHISLNTIGRVLLGKLAMTKIKNWNKL